MMRQRLHFLSLRGRLIALVLIAVLPAFFLTVYTASERKRDAANASLEDAVRLARLARRTHEHFIESTRQLLVAISKLGELQSKDAQVCSRALADLLKEYPIYTNFGLTSPEGWVIASAIPIAGIVPVTDRIWFQQAVKTRQFAIGDFQVGRITGQPAINFGLPILNKDGTVRGVLYAALSLSWLNELVHQAQLPAGYTSVICDHGGTILARYPDPGKWVGHPVRYSDVLADNKNQEGTFEATGLDGVKRLYAFASIIGGGRTDIRFLIGIPLESAYAPVIRVRDRNLVLLSLMAIMAIILTLSSAEFFLMKPVRSLLDATRKVREGDLSVRTGMMEGRNELGDLGRRFDEMTAALQQRVTERDRAEKALRDLNQELEQRVEDRTKQLAETEERLVAVMDNSQALIYLKDCEGHYLLANRQFESVLRIANPVIDRKTDYDLFPRQIAEKFVAGDRRVIDTNAPVELEETVPLADGTHTYLSIKFPLHDTAGRCCAIGGISTDITARKRAEQALEHSMAEVRDLFERTPCGYHSLDANGLFLNMNETELRWFGYTREELIGKRRFPDLLTETGKKKFEETFPRFKSQGEIKDLEYDIVCKDGSLFPVEVHAVAIRDAEGRFVMTRTSLTDARQRKRAEEQVSLIFNLTLDMLCIASFEGYFLKLSPTWSKTLGWTDDELRSRPFIEFVHPDDRAATNAAAQRLINREVVVGFDNRYRCKDGSWRWLSWSASVAPGRNLTIAAARDITDRKHAEEALAKTAANLARSNSELEQFAYVASHDLQEPLRMVTSYMQLLERRYRGRLDTTADEFISYAVDGAKRMQALIQDLLAYARVGAQAAEPEPVDCAALVKRVLGDLQVAVTENHAEVSIEPLPTVQGNSRELAQLFQNLIANALKFRGDATPQVRITASQNASNWIFSIQDNGIGIPPEHRDRVFGIFQRLHSRDKYPGTGIGLALCKKIVERHGGRIWIESQVGRGTTFYFTIPEAA